jgi:hypothetical protein
MEPLGVERRLSSNLAAGIVGYSRLMSAAGSGAGSPSRRDWHDVRGREHPIVGGFSLTLNGLCGPTIK